MNKERILKIAHYLGSNGLYKEAARLKKIANEFDPDFELLEGQEGQGKPEGWFAMPPERRRELDALFQMNQEASAKRVREVKREEERRAALEKAWREEREARKALREMLAQMTPEERSRWERQQRLREEMFNAHMYSGQNMSDPPARPTQKAPEGRPMPSKDAIDQEEIAREEGYGNMYHGQR